MFEDHVFRIYEEQKCSWSAKNLFKINNLYITELLNTIQ